MKQKDLENIHAQLLSIYKNSLLPIVNKYFNNEINEAHEKSGVYHSTLVTEADLAINKVLIEQLPQVVPGASIISEESEGNVSSKYTFVIDPIDGTHTFARNLDDWGISINLCESGKVIYSVIYFPNSKTEYYYAIKDVGSFDSTGYKFVAKKLFKFKPTLVCAPSSRRIGRELINFTKGRNISFKVYGSVVYAGYTLFRGGTDVIVIDTLSIWDVLGCVFIAEQAGFVIKWFGDIPKIDNATDYKAKLYTVMIYKPDFDKDILKELIKIVEGQT